jgi:hypothetical protein
MRLIYLESRGRFANKLLQYTVCKSLAIDAAVEVEVKCNNPIEEIGVAPCHIALPVENHIHIYINDIVFDYYEIVNLLKNNENIVVVVRSYCSRIEYIIHNREKLKELIVFNLPKPAYIVPHNHILFHIRIGDALGKKDGGPHFWYHPLSISYYKKIIQDTNLIPVFIGEFSDDIYTNALKLSFPKSVFTCSDDPNQVFSILKESSTLGLAISTFSLMAIFFGNQEIVHFPIDGLFNPENFHRDTGEHNFIMNLDYITYWKFPKGLYFASNEEIFDLLNKEIEIIKLDTGDIEDIYKKLYHHKGVVINN